MNEPRYPDRVIQCGEPCPWCKTPVGEVLTCSPPKCPTCLGFLGPPLYVMLQNTPDVPATVNVSIMPWWFRA